MQFTRQNMLYSVMMVDRKIDKNICENRERDVIPIKDSLYTCHGFAPILFPRQGLYTSRVSRHFFLYIKISLYSLIFPLFFFSRV